MSGKIFWGMSGKIFLVTSPPSLSLPPARQQFWGKILMLSLPNKMTPMSKEYLKFNCLKGKRISDKVGKL
jgi:hypothetical protein